MSSTYLFKYASGHFDPAASIAGFSLGLATNPFMRPVLRVTIIGGGIAGLASAYRLLARARERAVSLDLTLLESSDRLGGVIQTDRRDGFLLEKGPDCFLSVKPAGLALAKELGLESELIGTQPDHRRSFIVRNGRLLQMPQDFYLLAPISFRPFLFSPVISPFGKMRLLLDLVLPARRSIDDESLASFVLRRLGREALERVAQPMVAGIYSADPYELSLMATFPRFLEMEQKYGSVIRGLRAARAAQNGAFGKAEDASGPRYGLFLSFRQGMDTLTKRLAERIAGCNIRMKTKAKSIVHSSKGWEVRSDSGETLPSDLLVLAISAPTAQRLLRDVAPSVSSLLSKTSYSSVATINFAYSRRDIDHPLDGMGFVVPAVENRLLLGCSFSSEKFIDRAPEGSVLLRAFVGQESTNLDDSSLISTTQRDLERLLQIHKPPTFTSLSRWTETMPRYSVGHLQRLQEMESLLKDMPGLFLVGNGYRGIGIPDIAEQAEQVAYRALQKD